MIRLDFGSMHEVMHLYQASLAAKFDSEDKSLLVSEPLANAIDTLIEALYQDARLKHNEDLEQKMRDALTLQDHYPQYQTIIDRFVEHGSEIDWLNQSEGSRKSYLSLAVRPFSASDQQIEALDKAIVERLKA